MTSSQRFCLRWNNHQSNLLSVFDQLLHDEAFVDVTLAVEGQLLRAHKMVLSACSPYFQALFVGHPDKHPIVILKDVPFADMRSLLDFMYRGEVSVDQDRLTAFLKVAESLRIKGLTEVNEERCDLPSLASSLLNAPERPPPPPHLHRLHHLPPPPLQAKRPHHLPQQPLPQAHQHPLLGSALTAPKRKRGRPRKLSGSSGGTPAPTSPDREARRAGERLAAADNCLGGTPMQLGIHGPPDLLEVNMPEYHRVGGSRPPTPLPSPAPAAAATGSPQQDTAVTAGPPQEAIMSPANVKNEQDSSMDRAGEEQEPTPGTSHCSEDGAATTAGFKAANAQQSEQRFPPDLPLLRLVPRSELMPAGKSPVADEDTLSVEGGSSMAEGEGGELEVVDSENNNEGKLSPIPLPFLTSGNGCFSEPPPNRPVLTRRRVRRRAASSSDPAEQLTEMSVRGLNLFRYASVTEGVYKCMECEKADILKTFKNKYSFQRHAFLYHEGHQRKVFPCSICAKEFSRPDKMKNHMKTVHDCFMPKECVFPAVGFYLPP